MARKILILKNSISREALDEAHIRVVAEESLNFGDDHATEAWHITLTGLRKLRDCGYTTDRVVDLGDGSEFCVLQNPDGSPAVAGVNPALIKVVRFDSWEGDNKNREFLTKLIDEVLRPTIDRHVKITVPHGSRTESQNRDDKWFHIHIWSSPDKGVYETPSVMWGIDNPTVDSSRNVGVWMGGKPVTTDEGQEVGAFDNENLYIYFDAVHTANSHAQSILRKIFEFVAKFYNSPHTVDVEVVKANYVKACSRRAETEKKELAKSLEDMSDRVAKLQKDLLDTIRGAKSTKARLELLQTSTEDVRGHLGKEFDRLLAMDKVVGVNWRAEKMVVTTRRLFCKHPETGKWHDIGAFDIVIDSQSSDVLFWNRTRRVDAFNEGMNGPHLFPNGKACLGNMGAVIPVLVASYDWSAAVQQAIAFVESVNLDDGAGRHIGKWPTVNDAEKKKLEEESMTYTSAESALAEAAGAVDAADEDEDDGRVAVAAEAAEIAAEDGAAMAAGTDA